MGLIKEQLFNNNQFETDKEPEKTEKRVPRSAMKNKQASKTFAVTGVPTFAPKTPKGG